MLNLFTQVARRELTTSSQRETIERFGDKESEERPTIIFRGWTLTAISTALLLYLRPRPLNGLPLDNAYMRQ